MAAFAGPLPAVLGPLSSVLGLPSSVFRHFSSPSFIQSNPAEGSPGRSIAGEADWLRTSP